MNLTHISIVFALSFMSGSIQAQPEVKTDPHSQELLKAPRVIHPRFREKPTPSNGIHAVTNPPSFLIPLQPGKKNNTYSFRLSSTKDFDPDKTMARDDVAYAIFNPHQKLPTGEWHWQYRYGNEQWSVVHTFFIDQSSEAFVTLNPKALIAQIPKNHPRAIILEKDLDKFRARNLGSSDALEIIRQAELSLKRQPPKEKFGIPTINGSNAREEEKIALDASKKLGSRARQGIDPLAKAYLLTGKEAYAKAAIQWATEVASWDPHGVSMINNFGDSDCMLMLAITYDICHDLLSEEIKEDILASIRVRAQRFYDRWTDNIEAKIFSGHVWQHILERLFKTSLATIHAIPEAADWLAFVYEMYLARSPVLGPDDGGWWNGTHYFELNTITLLEIPMILKRLTGIDYLRSPFYQNNVKWMLYSFPPNSYSEGFGNGTEKQFGQKLGVLGYADVLSRIYSDSLASFVVDQHLLSQNATLDADDEFRWFRLCWELPPRPLPLKPHSLPLARSFPETGTVNIHSDLINPEKNLMVSMRSSPYGSTSHAHADQNSFNIQYGGERIFYTSGHRPSMGVPHYTEWFKATKGHNTILVDGKGQPIGSSESYGWLPRFLHGHKISYALGDASMAYDNIKEEPQKVGLEKFRRHMVFLRPNIIVIYDELAADHPADWSWLLHSMQPTELDKNGTLICSTDNAKSLVNIYGSTPIEIDITTKFEPQPVNFRGIRDADGNLISYPDQWHVNAKSSIRTNKMRYLAIIQVLPMEPENKPPFSILQKEGDQWKIGTWSIEAGLDLGKSPYLLARDDKATVGIYYGADQINIGDKVLPGDALTSISTSARC